MKKSENVEIRIDHATKKALQDKAEAEQRNVSEVLRTLIQDYLGEKPRRKRSFVSAYAGWTTAAAIALFSASTLIPTAVANNLKLDFKGEIVTQADDGERLRTIDSVIEFDDEGGTIKLPAGASETIFELNVSAITLKDQSRVADIKMKIINIDGPERHVLAEPQLIAPLGQVSRIEIGSESGDVYRINLVPSEAD